MLHSGLVSITFRHLSPVEIIRLVQNVGLEGIEWGGDVHVPHGDLARAHEVRKLTEDAGLIVTSYGSYYRVAVSDPALFDEALASALELGAPTIRVWAGQTGSQATDDGQWARVIEDSRRIADLAAVEGLSISYEYHDKTLTDTDASALKLLESVAHPAIRTYWQPPHIFDIKQNNDGLGAILPWLTNVHVFHWQPGSLERLPLAAGESAWLKYLRTVLSTQRDHYVLLEHVRDDAPEAFAQDARTLKSWLEIEHESG